MSKQARIQIVLLLAAGCVFFAFGYRIPSAIVWSFAVVLALLGLLAPSALQTLQELSARLSTALGTGLGVMVLTAVYYSLFTIGALLLRARGRDPLNRRFPADGRSNWVCRVGYGTDSDLYSRQYSRPHGHVPHRHVEPQGSSG